jgi:CRP-like cAMP-binding protein
MPALPALAERNSVLRSLPAAELSALLENLEPRRLRLGQMLAEPGEDLEEITFPASAVISLVAESEDGMSVEVATIGNEGLVGAERFVDVAFSTHRGVCQVEGQALVGRVQDVVDYSSDSSLARAARRYLYTVLAQAGQGVLCNRLHPLEQRAARWLLMVRDRVDGPRFRLTHDFFATMLGTHRPSVSVAAGMLQQAGLIRYTRGIIEILDRDALVAASCPCYEVVAANYAAAMAPREP